jgi:predicted transposase YbfD/YdcC
VIERTTTFDKNEEPTIAFYSTSHSPKPGCARYFSELARGHWGGCESRNHWVRDACMREDKTRSKNYNLNCNLSALRVCLVALKADLHPEPSWPELQECCQHDPLIPFRALVKHSSK